MPMSGLLPGRPKGGLRALGGQRTNVSVGATRAQKEADGLGRHTDRHANQDEQDDGQIGFQIHGGLRGLDSERGSSRSPAQKTLVPTARLELAQLSPLPPQDSVSTNFTTSALSSCASACLRRLLAESLTEQP